MIRIAAEEARAPAEILARYKKLLQEKPESRDPGFRSLWGFYRVGGGVSRARGATRLTVSGRCCLRG